MKKLALAAAITAAASTSMAQTTANKFADPIVEPEIIIEETRQASYGIVVPIMALLILLAALATR